MPKRGTSPTRVPSEGDATSFSDEAGQAVLGAYCDPYLTNPDLPTEWLYREAHQEIHRAILAIKDRGDEVSIISLSNELHARGKLAEVGGPGYLSALTTARDTLAYTDGQIRTFVRDVKRHAENRFE